MEKPKNPLPLGHVLVPAATIAALSVLLAVGLGVLRVLDRLNDLVAKMVLDGKQTSFPNSLPAWSVWFVAIALAFGIAIALLSVPAMWRRLVLWISLLAVVGGWGPVLSLAAYSPDIGAPFVAVLWSGMCALVYCHNHRMAVDEISPVPES